MDAKEFDAHAWTVNSYGFTLVSVCLGHELGLFDLMVKENRKMTSQEIADLASMKERYIREWLGGMVAAQYVLLEDGRYFIPQERHGTIKAATQWATGMSAFLKRFDKTKNCFRKDGPSGDDLYQTDGHMWSFYGGFREKTGDGFLDQAILPTVKEFPDMMNKLDSGCKVLDIGCGNGKFAIALAKRFPNSQITGADLSERALNMARESPEGKDLNNTIFIKLDAHNIDPNLEGTFDVIHINDVLHDLPDPKKALPELAKVLTPNGKMICIEVRPHSNPSDNIGDMTASMFYTCSTFTCLQNSMLHEPKIGYGACWGIEEVTKAVEQHFNIEKRVDLPLLHAILICSKKAEA